MKGSQLKNNDTFYYILHTYGENDSQKYIVMPYCFDSELHYMFDENLMFSTEKEADDKAKELNLSLHEKNKKVK